MRPSLFGNLTDDVSLYEYLALRVRAGGDPKTRNGYFVNIQTDGPVQSDLWQHRLYLRGNGDWEDVYVSETMMHDICCTTSPTFHSKKIPFKSFMLTNSGEAVSSEMTMMQEAIRSVGVSLLGGKANIQGQYELGIDCIGATNDVSTITKC